MPTKLPNGTYRVQIRVSGFPTIDRTFNSLKAADEFERDERAKISLGPTPLTKDLRFDTAVELYQRSGQFRKKKLNTQKTERSRIRRAVEALGGYSLENLADGQRIRLFVDTLHDEKLRILERKPNGKIGVKRDAKRRDGDPDGTLRNESIRLEIAAISAVMNWAVEMDILVSNPIKHMQRPSDLPRRRRLHRDEELAIFTLAVREDLAGTRMGEDVRFLALLRELGCRPSELAELRREDIDLESRALRFRDTKNGTDRTVPIVEAVADLLSPQLVHAEVQAPDSPFLFTTFGRDGKARRFYYRSAVDRLREEGVVEKDFFAAACRREHASAAFEHGLHHEDIRKQTGHKSIKALEIYNVSDALHPDARRRLEGEARRRAMERFEDMAAALKVSVDDLQAFVSRKAQEQRTSAGQPGDAVLRAGARLGITSANPPRVGDGGARTAMRRATTPLPPGSDAGMDASVVPATSQDGRKGMGGKPGRGSGGTTRRNVA